MPIPLADAIEGLRDQLREAVVEARGKDILFTPQEIELELGIEFETEAKAGGGFKLLAFLDLSAEAKATRTSAHKITIKLAVVDHDLKPLQVRSTRETAP